ncbi:MAG: hypothetical protein RIT28_5083 [Pseudomonadota bacterium]
MTLAPLRLSPLLLTLLAFGCRSDDKEVIETGLDTAPVVVDEDGDGFSGEDDCDDNDAAVNPGAEELCDELDNNCDGAVDEGVLSTFYADGDGDGYGVSAYTVEACTAPEGYTEATEEDCDDGDAAIYPGATEDDCLDPTDYNCDGSSGLTDGDGDGFAACEECDDATRSVNPSATEICDGIDNDCNGEADIGAVDAETWYQDADADAYGDADFALESCEAPEGYAALSGDCDDAEPAMNPGATELCDSLDNDCDGVVDDNPSDAATWYSDRDSDGYGDPATGKASCEQPAGTVENDGDCNDKEALAWDGATEVCDEVDNNCDGATDEGVTSTYYLDSDEDGYGNPSRKVAACDAPDGYTDNSGDCDDTEELAWTGATEVCDEVDNNCDGTTDEGLTTTYYLDADEDGYGNPSRKLDACDVPDGYTTNSGDCDDKEPLAWTGAKEVCDDADNDCDGSTDEGVTSTWYLDYDGDGFGRASGSVTDCTAPSSLYVADGDDCDDTDVAFYPGATEGCDGYDYDCDGDVDNDGDGDGYSDVTCGGNDCDDADAAILPEPGAGCAVGATCLDILADGYTTDGVYTVDPDGYGAGDDPHDVYCDQTTDGGGWTRVYYQDSQLGGFFAVGEFEKNRADPTNYRYAILKDLEDYRRGGEIEFLMRWPGHTTYTLAMQWAQTSNPVTDTAGAIPTGYRAISIPYTSNGWSAGLQASYSPSVSMLDGTMSPLGNWYYAVGTTYCWGSTSTGCQPAPSGGAHIAELLVR